MILGSNIRLHSLWIQLGLLELRRAHMIIFWLATATANLDMHFWQWQPLEFCHFNWHTIWKNSFSPYVKQNRFQIVIDHFIRFRRCIALSIRARYSTTKKSYNIISRGGFYLLTCMTVFGFALGLSVCGYHTLESNSDCTIWNSKPFCFK